MMMELDATHPKLLFRNLQPAAFWTTFGHPFVHFTPFWSVRQLMAGLPSIDEIHTNISQNVGVWANLDSFPKTKNFFKSD
jgi:hypothetical protein